MPTAAISIRELNRYLPKELSPSELEDYLEQLGCDIEGQATIYRFQCRSCQTISEFLDPDNLPSKCPECLSEGDPPQLWLPKGEEEVIRMDLLPVRPDLFDVGGMARAIRGLMGVETGPPQYSLRQGDVQLRVEPSVDSDECHRPYIASAVIRNVRLDELSLKSLMKLQENLHWALGRNRKLASIGVYDLKTISPPVYYRAVGKEEIKFIPLQAQGDNPLTPSEILETHPKGMAFKHLLEKFSKVPLLVDSRGQVLSMPPIINSEETKVTPETTDFFIDVTGISDRTVEKTLNILVTSLLELFPTAEAETVAVHYPGREPLTTPNFTTEEFEITAGEIKKLLGLELSAQQAAELLEKMRHRAEVSSEKPDTISVKVPPFRNDIIHPVDLIEDVAMAYNYKNIQPTLVPTMTVASERPERKLANTVRQILTGLGFFETMSLLLSNPEEQYQLMGWEDPQNAVVVENPASYEQSILRTSLLPQLLKLFALNRGQTLPQKLFEIDDVVKVVSGRVHPVEELHLAAGILDNAAGYSDIKAVCEAVARELQMPLEYKPLESPGFIPGRAAALFFDGRQIGLMGEIHPEVLEKLHLAHPIAVMEIDLSHLLPEGWNEPLV